MPGGTLPISLVLMKFSFSAYRKDRQSILSNNNDFIRKPFHFLYLFSVGNLLLNLARCEIQLEDPYSTWFKKGVFKLYYVGRKIEMAQKSDNRLTMSGLP